MNPLLQQFLSEARDFLQGISEKLMQLEKAPADKGLMTELFRFVHTLKGNSGLFEFPEMTRVLHAGEDLLDAVRNGRVDYSLELADRLLDAMDFVGILCDEIEETGAIGANYASDSARLTESLKQLNVSVAKQAQASTANETGAAVPAANAAGKNACIPPPAALADIPETLRMAGYRLARQGTPLHWLQYAPAEECFFQGEDPFFQAQNTPELLWGGVVARGPWPKLAELDAYHCVLDFHMLTSANRAELEEYYRYVPEQISIGLLSPLSLIIPMGDPNGGPVYEDFVSDALALLQANDLQGLARITQTMLDLSSPDLWLASALRWLLLVLELEPINQPVLQALIDSLTTLTSPDWQGCQHQDAANVAETEAVASGSPAPNLVVTESQPHTAALKSLVATQRSILLFPVEEPWQLGRLKSAATTLMGCVQAFANQQAQTTLQTATAQAIAEQSGLPLLSWIDSVYASEAAINLVRPASDSKSINPVATETKIDTDTDSEIKFGRRADDVTATGAKTLKVDQIKIDRLMNLIGEMVVSKNALPYLAGRAETVFGVRDLSREIKAQYAVINRIAEEMQDAIMQVRMLPVSFVFQRFPRLVRDISRKLGKEVNLILEGEDTEADKNVIESLGDPLVHIVRNSLDHGFELPEVRQAAGKPAMGTLIIRATQESDRVIIEIIDDGKGIDPEVVKRKAYEKGLLDETALERISDHDAINLIFAAGFSTAEVISDLSGRGVGMDVVRTAIEKVNGSISLDSVKGKGTHLRLSLPLSMAVTNVMIIESDGQLLGVPMDNVVETVRVPRAEIISIKQNQATVLRNRIVPIKAINTLLGLTAEPQANADDELAVLVVRLGEEAVGLLVDNFRETIDIILKPMDGVLGDISAYAGSALMGDGSVLLVLNIKELLP